MADSHTQRGSKPETAKSITSTWTATPVTLFQLRYHARYDIPEAKLSEWYSLWYKHIGWRGKVSWKPYKDYTYASMAGGGKDAITGNYDWAKQVSKDLGIEMPPATHRLSQRLLRTLGHLWGRQNATGSPADRKQTK